MATADTPHSDRPGGGSALEIRGPGAGLLDEPLALRVRYLGVPEVGQEPVWRARLRDDDGRVWRAVADSAAGLIDQWSPAKPSEGRVAAFGSLRPRDVEVRVEAADGRAATRSVARSLVGEGVRVRRWRGDARAILHLPAEEVPAATVLLDVAGDDGKALTASLAGPLLASRGVLVLSLLSTGERSLREALSLLAQVPGAGAEVRSLEVHGPGAPALPDEAPAVVLPPGVGLGGEDGDEVRARGQAWDRLLEALGARPRSPRDPE